MRIARFLSGLILVFSLSTSVSWAFKPTNEQYGHTMITRSILSKDVGSYGTAGYRFGVSPSGTPYVVPQFSYRTASGYVFTFTDEAIQQVVLGAQTRDWMDLDTINNVDNLTAALSIHCSKAVDVRGVKSSKFAVCPLDFLNGDYVGLYVTGDLGDGDGHFDDDNFSGSSRAIHRLLWSGPDWETPLFYNMGLVFTTVGPQVSDAGLSVIDLLRRKVRNDALGLTVSLFARQDLIMARIKLGKALHTLQDFYAHSTWADFRDPSELFTPITDSLSNLTFTWPDFVGTNYKFPDALGDVGVCIDSKFELISLDATILLDCATTPWRCVDVQPPTFDNNNGNYQLSVFAKNRQVISTGAWGPTMAAAFTGVAPWNRCDHGSDAAGSTVSGIAKDAPFMPFMNKPPVTNTYSSLEKAAENASSGHLTASYQAARHSVILLEALVNIIKTTAKDALEADAMVLALLGVESQPPVRAVIIDQSASMNDVIAGIRDSLEVNVAPEAVQIWTFRGSEEPVKLGIELSARLTELGKGGFGGGNCQAPALSALLKIIDQLPPRSSVHLFTDATPSDPEKLDALRAAAGPRQIQISSVISGGCGSDRPELGTYKSLAAAGSGSVQESLPTRHAAGVAMQYLLEKQEFVANAIVGAIPAAARAARRADATSADAAVSPGMLYSEAGQLQQPRTVNFPVDAGMTLLMVTASAPSLQAALRNPSGQAVTLTSFGTDAVAANIPSPATGVWTLELSAPVPSQYSLQVEALGGVQLSNVAYESVIEVGPRSGHEYPMPMAPTPPIGKSRAVVQLAGIDATSVTMRYLSNGGGQISSFELPQTAPGVFAGIAQVPSSAYWVSIEGQGAAGSRFARMWRGEHPLPSPPPAGFVATHVTPGAWVPGQIGQATVSMFNLGSDETLTLTARSNVGTVQVTPSTVSLASGAKASALLSVSIPASAAVGASAGLFVTLTSSAGSRDIEVPITIQAVPLPTVTLNVTRAGTGSGTVVSAPSGINCGTACSAPFTTGTSVSLSATPATGSTFTSWSGACSGTASCVVSMSSAQSVGASFSLVSATAPVCTLSANPASISAGATSTLTATCTPAATSYVWTGGACAGTSAASCAVNLSNTTNFTVAGVNSGGTGAVASATVTVTAATKPVCTLSANPASITAGGSSTLTASCSPAASSYVWTGGTCTATTAATCSVTPSVSTSYTVAGVNAAGTGTASTAAVTVTTGALQPNADGTVYDPKTGLTWMRCAMGQTWTGSTCSSTAATYTWDQAMALTNTVTFAGKGDWRLPNIRELLTIVDRSIHAPAIDSAVFPNTASSYFWSSSPVAILSDYAWFVDFNYGDTNGYSKTSTNYVRLVRSGQSLGLLDLARPNTDYVDHGDGTTTHTPTGLMWQRCAVGQTWTGSTCSGTESTFTWDAARLLTNSFAGKTDWRMPSVEELESLSDYRKFGPAINTSLFPGTPNSDYFWSSSPNAFNSSAAWAVYFPFGGASSDRYRGADLAVRLVRGKLTYQPITEPTNTECFFNWAEARLPEYLSPPNQPTLVNGNTIFRTYPDTFIALGLVNSTDVRAVGGVLGTVPLALGVLGDWLPVARAAMCR